MFDDDNDFGFSAVSEDELKAKERELSVLVQQTASEMDSKLTRLHKAIMPLLNNLEKNPEKEYIYWPDRTAKIKAFKQKIEGIMKE